MVKKLFGDPRVRLAWKALVVGAAAFVTFLSAADNPADAAVWKGALAAAGWAAIEAFTPLNALVGWFKDPK